MSLKLNATNFKDSAIGFDSAEAFFPVIGKLPLTMIIWVVVYTIHPSYCALLVVKKSFLVSFDLQKCNSWLLILKVHFR